MKTTAALFVSVLLMISSAFAGTHVIGAKSHKRPVNKETVVKDRINGMLGNPVNLLNGHSQSVMVSYSVDDANIIHVQEVVTANEKLKNYVVKHLDGKKINNGLQGESGIVKVHFNVNSSNNYYFQY